MSSDDLDETGSIDIGSGSIDPRDFQAQRVSARAEHYLAVLVHEATSEAPGHVPFYEESFVLLKAESRQEAAEKANSLGKQQEASFDDEQHRPVTWKLKQVVEVKPVEDDTFDDGSELYSRFFRNYEAYRGMDPLTEDE